MNTVKGFMVIVGGFLSAAVDSNPLKYSSPRVVHGALHTIDGVLSCTHAKLLYVVERRALLQTAHPNQMLIGSQGVIGRER